MLGEVSFELVFRVESLKASGVAALEVKLVHVLVALQVVLASKRLCAVRPITAKGSFFCRACACVDRV